MFLGAGQPGLVPVMRPSCLRPRVRDYGHLRRSGLESGACRWPHAPLPPLPGPRSCSFPGPWLPRPLASGPPASPAAQRGPTTRRTRPRRAGAGWAAVTPAPAGRRGPAPDSLSRRQPLGSTQSHLHWPPRGRGLPQLSQLPGAWGAPAGPPFPRAGRPARPRQLCPRGLSAQSRRSGPGSRPPTARVPGRLFPTPPGTGSGLPGRRGSACAVGRQRSAGGVPAGLGRLGLPPPTSGVFWARGPHPGTFLRLGMVGQSSGPGVDGQMIFPAARERVAFTAGAGGPTALQSSLHASRVWPCQDRTLG